MYYLDGSMRLFQFPLLIVVACWLVFSPGIPGQKPGIGPEEDPLLKVDLEKLEKAGLTPASKETAIQLLLGRAQIYPDTSLLAGEVDKLIRGPKENWEASRRVLISWGEHSLGLLKKEELKNSDKAVQDRIQNCLQYIQGTEGDKLLESAIRVLAAKPGKESTAALLQFLPFAGTDNLRDSCETAVKEICVLGSQSYKEALTHVKDAHPRRRALVAEIIAREGTVAEKDYLHLLFQDGSPMVRKKLATTFLEMLDPRGILPAIDLMETSSLEEILEVESILLEIAGEWGVQGPRVEDSLSNSIRRGIWRAWWDKINSQELLQPLKKLAPDQKLLLEADRLIIAGDAPTLKIFLDRHLNNSQSWLAGFILFRSRQDPNLAKIVSQYQNQLSETQKNSTHLPSYFRLVQMRNPPGGLEAMVAAFPACFDEENQGALVSALVAMSKAQSGMPVVWETATKSPLMEYRILASRVLPGLGFPQAKTLSEALATDANPLVSAEVCLAQAKVGQKDRVPQLISLLSKLPREKMEQVEQFLVQLAGETAPNSSWETVESREKSLRQWRDWWDKAGPALVIKPNLFDQKNPKNFLVTEAYDPKSRFGRVFLMNPKGKVLWEVGNLSSPADARLLGSSRVLMCEAGTNRVTERDLKGTILWEKPASAPFAVQRNSNGNTFIACRNSLLEVDRQGKEVFKFVLNNDTILAAWRYSSNHYGYVTYAGNYARLDATGKEIVKSRISFPTNYGVSGGGFSGPDRVLVSIPQLNKVLEFDLQGKQTWEAEAVSPGNPVKLANGNVLVPTLNSTKLVEIRRDGRLAWESAPGQFRAVKAWKYP